MYLSLTWPAAWSMVRRARPRSREKLLLMVRCSEGVLHNGQVGRAGHRLATRHRRDVEGHFGIPLDVHAKAGGGQFKTPDRRCTQQLRRDAGDAEGQRVARAAGAHLVAGADAGSGGRVPVLSGGGPAAVVLAPVDRAVVIQANGSVCIQSARPVAAHGH